MKKSTKIIIAIVVIVLIIAAIIGFFVIKDLKQEKNLETELNDLLSSMDSYPLKYEELETKLNRTATTGSYKDVETSVKEYMRSFINSVKSLDTLFDSDDIINAVSAENYKNDGPDFVKTKKNLSTASEELDKISEDLLSFFTEEKAMSFIKDKNLDDYYIDLYKQYTVAGDDESKSEIANTQKELTNSLNDFKKLINQEQEIIDFLVKNKRSWKIENDEIVFYSQTLIDKYNSLINEI